MQTCKPLLLYEAYERLPSLRTPRAQTSVSYENWSAVDERAAGFVLLSFCLSLPGVCFGYRQSCEISCRVSYSAGRGRMTHTFIWLCVPPYILNWTMPFDLHHSCELPHIQLGCCFCSVCVCVCICVRALLIFIAAIKVCWQSTKSGRLGSGLDTKRDWQSRTD